MYKNPKGLYKGNLYRSGDVMKRKAFQDQEFEIVGHVWDKDGCVIWACLAQNGQWFEVVPEGTKASRQITSEEANSQHGKMLTVRFSELSDAGIPQGNPVGVAIRDYE